MEIIRENKRMTIEEFLKANFTPEQLNEVYVRNERGEYLKVPGDTEYDEVSITYWNGADFVDITFKIDNSLRQKMGA